MFGREGRPVCYLQPHATAAEGQGFCPVSRLTSFSLDFAFRSLFIHE